jgi:hypothetical protein
LYVIPYRFPRPRTVAAGSYLSVETTAANYFNKLL